MTNNIPVIILAGGFGTRLQSVVSDVPKPMADINGVPFLQLLLDQLSLYNFTTVILAVSYKADIIKGHFGTKYKNLSILYSYEESALGSGGAIKQAMSLFDADKYVIMNGDTYVDVDFNNLCYQPVPSIVVTNISDVSRYGSLIENDGKIVQFCEKGTRGPGLINTGIVLIDTDIINLCNLHAFSFETEILSKYHSMFTCVKSLGKFIDIGIPEDYYTATQLFK